jgi:hypothetical protein
MPGRCRQIRQGAPARVYRRDLLQAAYQRLFRRQCSRSKEKPARRVASRKALASTCLSRRSRHHRYLVKTIRPALVFGIGTSKTPSETSTDSTVCVPCITPFVLSSKVCPAKVTPDVD